MSSSRWRRFAFFERSNLNIPTPLMKSLIPSSSTTNSHLPPLDAFYSTTELADEGIPQTTTTTTTTTSGNSSSGSGGVEGIGSSSISSGRSFCPTSYFSLTVSTALSSSIPSSSSSSSGDATTTNSNNRGFQSSHVVNLSQLVGGSTPTGTTTTTSSSPSSSSKNNTSVLVFLSSRNTSKIHILDISSRFHSHSSDDDTDGPLGDITPFATTPVKKEDRILREHMGEDASVDDSFCVKNRIVGLSASHTPMEDGCDVHLAVITDHGDASGVCVVINPQSYSTSSSSADASSSSSFYRPAIPFDYHHRGKPRCVSSHPGIVAVGTSEGRVVIWGYDYRRSSKQQGGSGGSSVMKVILEIPSPRCAARGGEDRYMVSALALCCAEKGSSSGGSGGGMGGERMRLYVGYKRKMTSTSMSSSTTPSNNPTGDATSRPLGVCCYDLGPLSPSSSSSSSSTFSGRFDLDGRDVDGEGLCGLDVGRGHYVVARSDGLYIYAAKRRLGVAPIDGDKVVMCCVPTSGVGGEEGEGGEGGGGGGVGMGCYALIASKDAKSTRDAVDIYDTNNKLVAFHTLLSPNHQTLTATGIMTPFIKNVRSSAIILTSGGTLLTLTEKTTSSKVSLLLQKNLFTAAIAMSYSDPNYPRDEISHLYRKHAEFLYRKGEHTAAMDQYIHTIGMNVVEPSHVIYRYLDAPKIPLLVTYLEALRTQNLATDSHLNLLKACYYKLNDKEKAERIAEENDFRRGRTGFHSLTANLDPMESLKIVCSLEAPYAAEALTVHGSTLARALPRETAGIVMSLVDGTYSPQNLASFAERVDDNDNTSDSTTDPQKQQQCERQPVERFTNAFLENPKLWRLIVAHCRKRKCTLTPGLRRTLLELTLEEWREAREMGDKDGETLRCNEAMAMLTDSFAKDIGDDEALVIVQLAGFAEGEILLYERLQMAPLLLERYAADGSERARRQMLAMCRSDPELLADVLGYFVTMAGEGLAGENDDDESDDSQNEAIFEDIQEALEMAQAQGVLPPVRIARILAGEGTGQFSTNDPASDGRSVPLSVALDYVGGILDEASKKIARLKGEVEEYNKSCNAMEAEINSLLGNDTRQNEETKNSLIPSMDIEQMYDRLREYMEDGITENNTITAQEEFWREMGHSEDRFETITRFFGKGIIQ